MADCKSYGPDQICKRKMGPEKLFGNFLKSEEMGEGKGQARLRFCVFVNLLFCVVFYLQAVISPTIIFQSKSKVLNIKG